MKKYLVWLVFYLPYVSCTHEPITSSALDETLLADYEILNAHLELTDLIACAAGKAGGLDGTNAEPTTSIFYYPLPNASEIRYYESTGGDPNDYTNYNQKELEQAPIFNGYLWKFERPSFTGERWGIVTFKTPGFLHICNPIRLKTNSKPTEVNVELLNIMPNQTMPSFAWQDGLLQENKIYFQVVSDLEGNLISGTYTFDQEFTFYNLDNVVLNISPEDPTPQLLANEEYRFTLMAVSEDNWVNLFFEKNFQTE